jgi:hypothetical protein
VGPVDGGNNDLVFGGKYKNDALSPLLMAYEDDESFGGGAKVVVRNGDSSGDWPGGGDDETVR